MTPCLDRRVPAFEESSALWGFKYTQDKYVGLDSTYRRRHRRIRRPEGELRKGEEPGTAKDKVAGGRMEMGQVTQQVGAEPRFEHRVI